MDGVVVVATFRVHPGRGDNAVAAFAPTIHFAKPTPVGDPVKGVL